MAIGSNNPFPSVLVVEGTVPATPSAGQQRVYIDSTTHLLKVVNSSGTASNVGATAVTDATITTSDITTNNASTSKHGFLLKLDNNAAHYMNGQGAWTTPAGSGYSGPTWTTGTSMPGSPSTNDRITRTDLGLDAYYDGTRWLTVEEFTWEFSFTNATAGQTQYVPLRTAYDIYVTDILSSVIVFTTNNGTNYWSFNLFTVTSANAESSIGSHNTSGYAAGAWTPGSTAINTAVATSSFKALDVHLDKVLTPGALYGGIQVNYRLILT